MIAINVDGVVHVFHGDELTSAEQQAILFLKSIEEEKAEF